MPSVAATGIVLTPIELLYLGSLRGGKAVFGLDDPMPGYSEVQVAQAYEEAIEGLRRRRYLLVEDAEETIVLDEEVVRLVDTVVKPRRTVLAFMAIASAADATQHGVRRVFHVRGSSVAEIAPSAGEVRIQPLAERAAIADAVIDFWGMSGQPAARGQQIEVPQQAMHAAAKLAQEQGLRACLEHFVDLGVDAATAQSLAETFVQPTRNSALLTFDLNGPRGRTVGMGMLEGEQGLWRLRPEPRGAQTYVEVTPCDGATLAGLVREFVAATTGS